jgi:hypothetical protein
VKRKARLLNFITTKRACTRHHEVQKGFCFQSITLALFTSFSGAESLTARYKDMFVIVCSQKRNNLIIAA